MYKTAAVSSDGALPCRGLSGFLAKVYERRMYILYTYLQHNILVRNNNNAYNFMLVLKIYT